MGKGMPCGALANTRRDSGLRQGICSTGGLGALRCPIKVIGADPTLPYSYLSSLDLSDILEVEYDFLPETTHFLQPEQPEECVAAMRHFLNSIALTWSHSQSLPRTNMTPEFFCAELLPVDEVVITCGSEVVARRRRSYKRDEFVFDPIHYLLLLEQKTAALEW